MQNIVPSGRASATRPLRIALTGNPNCGKTTVFNALTGANQHVGNYPGVTVEKREGIHRRGGAEICLVDLPGTYSLTPRSPEERAARAYLVEEKPDVVVHVVDASNLERHLYLTCQLIELGVPRVIALNMSDRARRRGIEIDLERLTDRLGAPVVPTVGRTGEGIEELIDAAVAVAEGRIEVRAPRIPLPMAFEGEVAKLDLCLVAGNAVNGYGSKWLATQLLEGDEELTVGLPTAELRAATARGRECIAATVGESPETILTEGRYRFLSEVCEEAVGTPATPRREWSERIDAVVTNRIVAIPIFLALMYGVFQLTFTLGDPLMGWIETGFGWLGVEIASWFPAGTESPLASLLVDGVIGGVGGVIVFLPNILLLFLAIGLLEDTGYMARAAFLMDRLMNRVGLHGKSFIPLLIGFGCSVPAIMATRTLENRRDRLTTMLVAPLMSCGARLPIYALIIPAFFAPAWRAPMLWTIYMIGIALAIGTALLLRRTVFRGASEPFVMELPPYRLPTLRGVGLRMAERSWLYLKKAGTIILALSILLWALTSYPKLPETELAAAEASTTEQAGAEVVAARALEYSYAGRAGHLIEPVLAPMGFDWKIGTALVGAFAAKEVFVAQMGIVYATGGDEEDPAPLRATLSAAYSPLVGFCIMLFCLISAPCLATLAITRRESGSWRWAGAQFGGLTVLAWLLTTIVYQVGTRLGVGC